MSVSEDPADRAPIIPGLFGVARPEATGRRAAPTVAPGGLWRRVRLAAAVRWQAAQLDRELTASAMPRGSAALALHARRITGPRSRVTVARGLARVLRSASDSSARLTAAMPPHRREVLAARTVIDVLERRLRGPEPVTARGMAMLREFLTEPTSALYRPTEPGALGSQLRAAAAALEPSARWQ